jgi:hypothetical protein
MMFKGTGTVLVDGWPLRQLTASFATMGRQFDQAIAASVGLSVALRRSPAMPRRRGARGRAMALKAGTYNRR